MHFRDQCDNNLQHRLIASYGAEVMLFGSAWDEANAEAIRLANEQTDALYIHPFGHDDVRINCFFF